MSTSNNPFMNNNNGTFTNTPSQTSALFRNNTQTNSISNVLNGQSKEGSSNSIFKQKIDTVIITIITKNLKNLFFTLPPIVIIY